MAGISRADYTHDNSGNCNSLINSTDVDIAKPRVSSTFANLNSEPAIPYRYLALIQA